MKERPQADLFANNASQSDKAGHRLRMREKLEERGPDAFQDYELLEMVLFNAIPRGDVKPLAKRLLARFGDFAHVVAAPAPRLREVEGAGPAVLHQLRLAGAASTRIARARIVKNDVIGSWDALIAYCTTRMAHQEAEEFRVLFLDRKNTLIADEALNRGTVDQVAVYPREVLKRALEVNASALIIAHNHPSGDPAPSRADIDLTKRIKAALAPVNITLHDHVVIGKDAHASLHALGLI